MAISLVTGGALTGTALNGANVTITLPTLAENDVVIVWGGTSFRTGITPGPTTAGYVSLASHTGTTPLFDVSWKRMGASPDTTVICKGSATTADAAAYGVYCLRGVISTGTPTDATTTTAGPTTSTNPDCPSITSTTTNAWILALALNTINDASITGISGYSNALSATANDTGEDISIGGGTNALTAPAAENPASFTTWVSGVWFTATVAIAADVPLTTVVSTGSVGSVAVADSGSATDSFDRADTNDGLGANWTGTVNARFKIATNVAIAAGLAQDEATTYTATSFNANQYSQVEVTVAGTTDQTGLGVYVRSNGLQDSNGYWAIVNKAGTNNISIASFKSAVYALITQRTTAWVDGDILKLSVETSGSNALLKVYKNGTQLGADITDTSPLTTGQPGLAYSSTITSGSVNNWEGGNLSTAASAAISGNGIIGSIGSILATLALAISGLLGTGSVGSLAADVSKALTGTQATASVGTAAPQVSLPLGGVAGTGSPGTVTVLSGDITLGVAGVVGTGNVGTTAPETSLALVGNTAPTAVGNVSLSSSAALTSSLATNSAGSLTLATQTAPTGTQGSGAPGNLAPTTNLNGVAGTGLLSGQASLIAGNARVITGLTITGTRGFVLSNITIGLTGVLGISGLDDTTPPLIGQFAIGTIGTVTPTRTISLTGILGTGAVGSLIPSKSLAVTGIPAVGAVGTLAPARNIAVSGNQGAGGIGTLAPKIALTGVSAVGATGNITPSHSLSFTGIVTTGNVGTVTPMGDIATAITGLITSGSTGILELNLNTALTSNDINGSIGTISPVQILTSVLTTTQAPGTLTPQNSLPLIGALATGAVDTVTPPGGTVVALTGIRAINALGPISAFEGTVYRVIFLMKL